MSWEQPPSSFAFFRILLTVLCSGRSPRDERNHSSKRDGIMWIIYSSYELITERHLGGCVCFIHLSGRGVGGAAPCLLLILGRTDRMKSFPSANDMCGRRSPIQWVYVCLYYAE